MSNVDIAAMLEKVLARPVSFHRIFATIAGGAAEGLFLSQAYYWSFRTTLDDEWFYKTSKQWEQETALTRREQEKSRKRLIKLGVLEEKRVGLPSKMYYRVNRSRLYEIIQETSSNPCGCQIVTNDNLECNNSQSRKAKVTNKNGENDNLECNNSQSRKAKVTNNLYTENTYRDLTETTSETTSPLTPQGEMGERDGVINVEFSESEEEKTQLKNSHVAVNSSNNLVVEQTNSLELTNPSAGENYSQKSSSKSVNQVRQVFEETNKVIHHGEEYKQWFLSEMGEVITRYRKSGRPLTPSPNDINKDFKSFIAKNANGGKGITYSGAGKWVVNCEKDPNRWEELSDLVAEWWVAVETGDRSTPLANKMQPDPMKKYIEKYGY